VVEKGKLFLWKDSISPLTQELLNIMDKYQVLDSVDVKRELGLLPDDFVDDRMVVIDDRLEGVSYFICKSDISKYKKKYHWKAFGYLKPPKIRCQ
jgi:cytochrome c-type biogenesis protein CcmE